MLLYLTIKDRSLLLYEEGQPPIEKDFFLDSQSLEIIDELLKNKKVEKLICMFAGDKIISQTKILVYELESSFMVDKTVVANMINEAATSFIQENESVDITVISKEIIHTTVNGYEVTSIPSQKIKRLELSVFLSAISILYREKLLEVLTRHVKKGTIVFNSYAFYISQKIHAQFGFDEFITLSAYETEADLSIKKNHGYFQTIPIPLGHDRFVTYIAGSLNVSKEIARSFIILHSEKKLEEALAAKMNTAYEKLHTTCDSDVKGALTDLAAGISLPEHAFIIINKNFSELYNTFFQSDCYHALCFTERGFIIHILEENTLINPPQL